MRSGVQREIKKRSRVENCENPGCLVHQRHGPLKAVERVVASSGF